MFHLVTQSDLDCSRLLHLHWYVQHENACSESSLQKRELFFSASEQLTSTIGGTLILRGVNLVPGLEKSIAPLPHKYWVILWTELTKKLAGSVASLNLITQQLELLGA